MSAPLTPLRSAVVNVGDELLLGEMLNDNQRWMLATLREHGLPAAIALSLPDEVDRIAAWIRALQQAGHDHVFVSGGIGGTHDDHTRAGIAKALDVELCRHEECFAILADKYGDRFNPQRQRMAWLPAGSELIANATGAPGFWLDGVYAFPGFPTMLQPMMLAVLGELVGDAPAAWITEEHVLGCAEGEIARQVEDFAHAHPRARIGIYPSSKKLGKQTTLRIRCPPQESATLTAFRELVQRLGA